MNIVPQDYIRIAPEALKDFVALLAQKAGMSEQKWNLFGGTTREQ
ncbi:hypothetical protein [Alicyclobacillus fodiniaquatilis]|uniref:Uncharacterized protein n=1 Tax=Alicyclobacillus fodiniaquatilis TaxID=1661150 RepID=A0ABW4JIG8_9BACL